MENSKQQNDTFLAGLLTVLGINIGIFIVGVGLIIFLLFFFYGFIMSNPDSPLSTISSIIVAIPTSFIGLSQLIYIIPWAIKLKRNNQPEKLKGVIAGGVITALLNSGCFLIR